MRAGASIELAARLLGRRCTTERPITVDQTNASVVVDEAFVVKWLQPPVPVPHPGVELIRHLAAAGFGDMPRLLGVDERDGIVHAIVSAYLPDARDGWDWFVDDVDAWLRGALDIEEVIRSSRRIAALTADVHSLLEDLDPSAVDLRVVAVQALRDLDQATAQLDGLQWLDSARIATLLEPLMDGRAARGHRIHGDLHVGQFLRSGDTMLLTDFDGNPMRDAAVRAAAQSPLADLASLVQSLHHVGAIVVKRRHPDRAADVEQFVVSATAAALDAYTAVHDVDADVLLAMRVAQELHEYAYSIAHLPHWRYVADDALPRLLEAGKNSGSARDI